MYINDEQHNNAVVLWKTRTQLTRKFNRVKVMYKNEKENTFYVGMFSLSQTVSLFVSPLQLSLPLLNNGFADLKDACILF